VSFDWSYSSGDSGQFDIGGYFINGTAYILADNDNQGTNVPFSFRVNSGDQFGFFVFTQDSLFGAGTLQISRFDFTGSFVPAPGAVALLGLAGRRRSSPSRLIPRRQAGLPRTDHMQRTPASRSESSPWLAGVCIGPSNHVARRPPLAR
jgi:hypothetical protein